jgi:hypothetical protein
LGRNVLSVQSEQHFLHSNTPSPYDRITVNVHK